MRAARTAGSIRLPLRPTVLVTIALFVLLPVLAFPELIFGQQTLRRSDISLIHYPYHIMVAGEWLAGRVPLWNPYQHLGIPLLAEAQVGVLYPFSLLFLSPLSPSFELTLYILLHFTLAAVFTYVLVRYALGLAWAPSVVAALAYGLGGFLMAQVPNVNIMTGAAWLPLALAGVLLATRRRNWLWALLAGIPLSLQVLAAQPQVVLYTIATLLGYAVYRLIVDLVLGFRQAKPDVRLALLGTGLVLTTLVCGMLLASPQLLPTYELLQRSERSVDHGLEFLTENSLPPALLANLVMPSAFGNRAVGFKMGDPFEEDYVYAGFLPLVLVFFAGGQWRKRDMLFFPLLLLGAILMALGRHTPLYQYVVQYLPGFSLFRIPARWLMVVNLAVAVLGAYGLQGLLEKGLSRKGFLAFLAAGLAIGLGLALTWIFRTSLLDWAANSVTHEFYRKLALAFLDKGFSLAPVYRERLVLRWMIGLTIPAVLLMVNILIAGVLLGLYTARRLPPRIFSNLVIAALALDLVVAGGTRVNPIEPAGWWQQLSGGARYVKENLVEGRVFPLGMGSERAAVFNLGQFFPSAHRIYSAGGHGSPLMIARHHAFLEETDPVQMLQVLGVRYILTEGRMGADVESVYPLVFSDQDSVVYENRNPLPHAFVVHDAILAETPEQALAYFQSRDIDPRYTVVLENDGSAPPPLTVSTPAEPGRAEITYQDPQRLDIQVDTPADGYLVLLDTYYPGWVASLDGVRTTIYRADYVVRAVFVPAGRHNLRFEYRPLSFRLGLGLSALALVVIIIAVWRQPRKAANHRSREFKVDMNRET